MKRISYQLDYTWGVRFEWMREIDAACDEFFRKRGLPVTGPTLKETIHAEAMARKREKQRLK